MRKRLAPIFTCVLIVLFSFSALAEEGVRVPGSRIKNIAIGIGGILLGIVMFIGMLRDSRMRRTVVFAAIPIPAPLIPLVMGIAFGVFLFCEKPMDSYILNGIRYRLYEDHARAIGFEDRANYINSTVPAELDYADYDPNDILILPAVVDELPLTSVESFSKTDIRAVLLPSSVTSIGTKAFADCAELELVVFAKNDVPGSYNKVHVSSSAFENCSRLERITGCKVRSMEQKAFRNCGELSQIDVSEFTATRRMSDEEQMFINRFKWIGQTVKMGSYGGTAVRWKVLATKGDTRTLIAVKGQDSVCFNQNWNDGNEWESSYIRTWLNDDFYTMAFSEEEQAKIIAGPTGDKVWLLSVEETKKYFTDDEDMMCVPTPYAKKKAYISANGAVLWWLRSPGCDTEFAAAVGDSISYDNYVQCEFLARPVVIVSTGLPTES